MKRGKIEHILNRRLYNFIKYVGNEEVDLDDYILKRMNAPKLDKIKKKELVWPESVYPIKNAPVEWWYFTGHLKSKEKPLGFEFCVFKIHPEIIRIGPIPLYLFKKKPYLIVHSAITDKKNKKFQYYTDSGLFEENKIEYDKLNLKLNDSSLKFNKLFNIKNKFIDLEIKPVKEIVKHFDEGLQIIHKNPESRAYYMSFTRLNVKGSVILDGKKVNASGEAWFDHQKSNMIKKSSLVGWDWFGIMLDDKTEIMISMIKDKKGKSKNYIGGTYVYRNSKKMNLGNEDIVVKNTGSWKSEKTGIEYPSGWEINIPKIKVKMNVIPYVKDQEIDSLFKTGACYWEGACKVECEKEKKKINGEAYVELVGYDKRIIQEIWKQSTVE